MPDLDLDGVGDLAAYVEWQPWPMENQGQTNKCEWDRAVRGFSFLAGLEFPTGEDEDTPVPGVVTPSLLQLGSGTYDPIVGLRYRWSSGRWRIFHQTTAQFFAGESDV
jgi:hypothetical protein